MGTDCTVVQMVSVTDTMTGSSNIYISFAMIAGFEQSLVVSLISTEIVLGIRKITNTLYLITSLDFYLKECEKQFLPPNGTKPSRCHLCHSQSDKLHALKRDVSSVIARPLNQSQGRFSRSGAVRLGFHRPAFFNNKPNDGK